ncbi:phosphotransferase family protein [Agarivorans gilvus]|uniref:Aminoglycoside phosphotransferase n=1 Tax=Agarivorans gilvus TaxID=680279 RepID=A0ABQ1I7B4_9ALTE|nr:aminoglycoside phosphotransferase family protein [Agarivorans gilvus]GGB18380.1 aminoglycoside phosphotransferase [Agarivorans gilvus]
MINLENLKLIGSGATADVYLYQQTKVIKLFNNKYSLEAVHYEASIAETVSCSTIAAPKYHQIVSIGDRSGIVYDYVPGEILINQLLAKPLQSISTIKRLARAQARLNATTIKGLPKQAERLASLIKRTDTIPEYQAQILQAVKQLAPAEQVCHGDFHVGNIIRHHQDFFVIDWMNAYSGNAEGDLLRSYLMLISPFMPFEMGPLKRQGFIAYKRLLAYFYLREYLKVSGICKHSLKKWWPIVAAARLQDQVPNEELWLKKIIKKHLKYLGEWGAT